VEKKQKTAGTKKDIGELIEFPEMGRTFRGGNAPRRDEGF